MQVSVISGSMSESSSSTALARRLLDALDRLAAAQQVPLRREWISLRDLAHPLTDALLTGFAGEAVNEAFTSVREAAGVIAVTPTYQASFSGLFKTFLDVTPEGLFHQKPVLLAATGGTGRHGLMIDHALRPLFAYLGAQVVPTGIYAATQDWGDPGLEKAIGFEEDLDARVDRAAGQLWWLMRCTQTGDTVPAGGSARHDTATETSAHDQAVAAFPEFVDFETLLGRQPE